MNNYHNLDRNFQDPCTHCDESSHRQLCHMCGGSGLANIDLHTLDIALLSIAGEFRYVIRAQLRGFAAGRRQIGRIYLSGNVSWTSDPAQAQSFPTTDGIIQFGAKVLAHLPGAVEVSASRASVVFRQINDRIQFGYTAEMAI